MFVALCIITDSALNQGTCFCDSMLNSQQCADREELCFTTLKAAKFTQRRLWLNGLCLWNFGAMTRTEYPEKTLCQFRSFVTISGLCGFHVHNFTLSAFKSEINPLAPDFFFILAHSVYKILITQEPKKLAL